MTELNGWKLTAESIQWNGTFGSTWAIRKWVNKRSSTTWFKSTPWHLLDDLEDVGPDKTGAPYFLLSSELGVLHIHPLDMVYYHPNLFREFVVYPLPVINSKPVMDMCL